MIRKLVLFGWLPACALAAAGVTGYRVVPGSDDIPHHLLTALLAGGGLGLVFLGTGLYLLGMGRLVRAVCREESLGSRWREEHRRLSRAGLVWCVTGSVSLVAVLSTGYPTHLGLWSPAAHHGLAWAAFAITLASLWRLAPIVTREEELVRSLDRSLEG